MRGLSTRVEPLACERPSEGPSQNLLVLIIYQRNAMALREPEGIYDLGIGAFKLERILEASWFSGFFKRSLKETTLKKRKKPNPETLLLGSSG